MEIPVLRNPFRSAINPFVREADTQVIQWVQHHGLATDAQWAEGYRASRFTWFAARCFPDADLPQLSLAAAFNVWLFLLDDSCDEVPTGQKYEYVRSLATDLSLVLAGYPVPAAATTAAMAGPTVAAAAGPIAAPMGSTLATALEDLWARLRQISTPDWQEHFVRGMYRYLDACKLEAQWLDMEAWPSLAAYTRYRPYLGAVHLEPALAEVLCGHHLNPVQRKDPRIEILTLLCCNVVCWSNDLFSLDKEWANGDRCNLALVLAHEREYDLEDAIREAAALHDHDVARFAALAEEVLAGAAAGAAAGLNTGPLATTPALVHYVHALQHIVAANMDWSIHDTRRYRFTFGEARSTA
ncbi:terpene synthase family protein [Dinghuibacter silviterrae]|uniref:Terpene synthase n=1 Tax=Dinghuibacter silviterrae TaxID=1539049 RepID=A0A4R8DI40_9BACT|nr:hypothetical protein [Dinghuibacter silviterrae]TDW97413.1 hypothetical protein EDB95_5262 [Dinghuibacter silviterrae]